MSMLQKHPFLVCLLLLCVVLLIWAYWETHSPKTTTYTLRSEKIPAGFDGFRIVQVSDLHNATFGQDNRKLLTLLRKAQPDLILLTGDLVDSRRTDLEIAVRFVQEAAALAPVCYAPGNHESRIGESYTRLKEALTACGVVILENQSIPLRKAQDTITVTGLTDPDFFIPWPDLTTEDFQVVLSHRPELLEEYANRNFDLVFTGHAHGGQARLPFIGGLFAPHQGFFPDYTAGMHTKNSTTMVISRGLGNAPVIPRFNNRPELILTVLEKA